MFLIVGDVGCVCGCLRKNLADQVGVRVVVVNGRLQEKMCHAVFERSAAERRLSVFFTGSYILLKEGFLSFTTTSHFLHLSIL